MTQRCAELSFQCSSYQSFLHCTASVRCKHVYSGEVVQLFVEKVFSGGLQLFTPFALGAVRSIATKIEGGRFSCRWSGHISNLNKFF